jgi:methylmalonyl-CoA mutase cobalamin-binding subunit
MIETFDHHDDLAELLPLDLPDGADVVREGRAIGSASPLGRSLYCEAKGVKSEREWREHARVQGIPCTNMNIGLATWPETREALVLIYEDALRRGIRPPDRFNLIAERRMGLPKHMRADAPQETGPVLWTDQDWWELAHTVPIQPEAGDNMVCGPGSIENALDALQAGVTYVGAFSQYVWRWPYWDDEVAQLTAFLKGAGVLAAKREQGICFDTYLEDGYPGVFHDYANFVGWAMIERYVCEELIGAAYSYSWGGLTHDPVTKSAVTLALEAVNWSGVPAAFIHGDTIGHTPDLESNHAVTASDLLFMKMTDLHYGLGGAPTATPVTEVERIPAWEEIASVQAISRKLEEYVGLAHTYIDWAQIEQLRDVLVAGGKRFFDSTIGALAASGIDVRDPGQVLIVLKRLGAARCEELFGAGDPDPSYPRGRRPLLRTDLTARTLMQRDRLLDELTKQDNSSLQKATLLVASTDVHEFAKFVLTSTLDRLGCRVVDCGINRDPEDIVRATLETAADAVIITTHNGVARSFATRLIEEFEATPLKQLPIYMGGILNEDIDGSHVPVDVRIDLHRLGIQTPLSIGALVSALRDLASAHDPTAIRQGATSAP